MVRPCGGQGASCASGATVEAPRDPVVKEEHMERLAIDGGPRAVSEDAKRVWPDIRDDDRAAVAGVLDRGVLGGVGAPEMTALESEWSRFVGTRHALLLNSGTAAIQIGRAHV